VRNNGGEKIKKTEQSEYHLEDDQSIRNYHRWLRSQKEVVEEKEELSYQPRFSFVIPVYNTVTEQLTECIETVLAQSYSNFELILVDDHSSWENVVPVLKGYETDRRVHVIYRTENGHISVATNDGIAAAGGDYIVFMDCDDTIEADALYEMAKKLNENPELDFIYSDEDKITEDGKIRHMPFFKPDWSPDLYMCMNYTNHLSIYRASIVKEIGGLRSEYNGSQDYDFTLRFMEKSDNRRVGHIPKILYHWRERKESAAYASSSKNYAIERARDAKLDMLQRNHIDARLEYIEGISQYRPVYDVVGNPLVSIIIPSKDHPDILKQCIDSITEFTDYENYEIIVVDNGSKRENKQIIEEYLCRQEKCTYLYGQYEFNFSRMCNEGAAHSRGSYLLFLNDDVEMIHSEWLQRMLGHAQKSYVGAVGAKLLYPKTTIIQHDGVSSMKGGPAHNFLKCEDRDIHYFGFNRVDYNCIAVTGACLLVETTKFMEAGGFDEKLPVAYNDVSLCFALYENGYYNVIRNDVVAYHHESLSRGNDHLNDEKLFRLSRELTRLYCKFPYLNEKDPFLNGNLHSYTTGLDLEKKCTDMRKSDLKGVVKGGTFHIDAINVTETVQILGWGFLDNAETDDLKDRFLIVQDAYGVDYIAPVFPVLRQDVADRFGDGIQYRYAGFECVLDKTQLRLDCMPYRIGILFCEKNGKKSLSWQTKAANVIREPKARKQICRHIKLENFREHNKLSGIQWWVDYNQQIEDYYEIRGFAFCKGNMHYQYQTSIILVASDNTAYEFEVLKEERIDVAYTFPKLHFLYNTGFNCVILKKVLESDKEYDVIIRLRNQFDSKDIRDVVTGQKIKV
jgi:glycosyltransferase involved in cell wall biosynthesis